MRDRRRLTRALPALAGLSLALAGCRGTEIEDGIGEVAWFSNMRNQAAIEPYEENMMMPPEGTVEIDAGMPTGNLPDDYREVANPIPSSPESLEVGKQLFDIYCAVCHGSEGHGGGNIEGPFPRGLINQLTTQRARDYPDGYIFGMITLGRGLMPSYSRVTDSERWHIVNYVRQLQRQAPREGG